MPESLSREELQRLYNDNAAGRDVMGKRVTFDEWLELREKARTDKQFLKQVLDASGVKD